MLTTIVCDGSMHEEVSHKARSKLQCIWTDNHKVKTATADN